MGQRPHTTTLSITVPSVVADLLEEARRRTGEPLPVFVAAAIAVAVIDELGSDVPQCMTDDDRR